MNVSLLSRRSLFMGAPLFMIPWRAFGKVREPDLAAIERRSGGKLGLFVIDTGRGTTLAWRADERFPFCSSSKGPLAAFVLWQVDHGQLRLDQKVSYSAADLLPYAPVTRAHVAEGAMTIEALCKAAVQYSDNTAANLLWRETGGPQALTAWMRTQGDTDFQLVDIEPRLNLSRFGDGTNTTTPQAMADSYSRFVLGDVLTPASRERLTGWLVGNTTGGRRLRAGLPPSWRVGDKTGTYNEGWFSTVDVGIAWPPNRTPLVISCFLTDTPNTVSAELAIADVARQVTIWAD
jgi:beta-lactamase class A